jgi:hypothetical protein
VFGSLFQYDKLPRQLSAFVISQLNEIRPGRPAVQVKKKLDISASDAQIADQVSLIVKYLHRIVWGRCVGSDLDAALRFSRVWEYLDVNVGTLKSIK